METETKHCNATRIWNTGRAACLAPLHRDGTCPRAETHTTTRGAFGYAETGRW